MRTKRILHLTLHREYFDEIATGRKNTEYRRATKYWEKRLLTPCLARPYDEIHFRNGYNPGCAFMRVEWKGLQFLVMAGELTYGIKLGARLEILNWDGDRTARAKAPRCGGLVNARTPRLKWYIDPIKFKDGE